MSSKLTIFKAALAKINAARQPGQPLAFVKNVYPGVFPGLTDMPAQAYPCIVIEVDNDEEKYFTTGMPPALKSDFKLFVSCLVFEAKPAVGLVGDAAAVPPVVGLIEFVDTLKNVLQADMTLGNAQGMQKVMFPACPFSFLFYPVREAKLNVTLESQLTTNSH